MYINQLQNKWKIFKISEKKREFVSVLQNHIVFLQLRFCRIEGSFEKEPSIEDKLMLLNNIIIAE
jgi:hypothetical protein